MSEENKDEKGLDMEEILDKCLERTGFKTLVKLVPNGNGEEADANIDKMLAEMGLKKGKLVAVIRSKDLFKKSETGEIEKGAANGTGED